MIDPDLKHDPEAEEECPLCKAFDEASDRIVQSFKEEGGNLDNTMHLLTWVAAKLITAMSPSEFWDRNLLTLIEATRERFDYDSEDSTAEPDLTESGPTDNGQSRSIH